MVRLFPSMQACENEPGVEQNHILYIKRQPKRLCSCTRVAQASSARSTSSNASANPARNAEKTSTARKVSFSCDPRGHSSDVPTEPLDNSPRPSIPTVNCASDNVPNIMGAMRSGRKSIARTSSYVASFAVDSVPSQVKSSMRTGKNSFMATSSSVASFAGVPKMKNPMRSSRKSSYPKATPSAASMGIGRPPLTHSESSPATSNLPDQSSTFDDATTGTVFTNPFEDVQSPTQPLLRRSATDLDLTAPESPRGRLPSYDAPMTPSKLRNCHTPDQEQFSDLSEHDVGSSEHDIESDSEVELEVTIRPVKPTLLRSQSSQTWSSAKRHVSKKVSKNARRARAVGKLVF